MKKIYKFISAVCLGGLALTSCNNDEFLTVNQYDIIDINAEFENDENALMGLTGVYDLMNPCDAPDGDWGFKPNLFSGTHPTMDTQATGWDKDYTCQNWDADKTELASGWAQAYAAISRANLFLASVEKAPISAEVKKTAVGEARAIRAFFYTYLAQTFGRVPMLATGEDYSSAPQKARAKDYNEMWDFIIDDFKAAADSLTWQPFRGQYGRATKGMALSYLADAYMWKAYRNGGLENNKDIVTKAYDCLKSVYDSKTYKLNPCFSTNWDCDGGGWNSECIWAEILDEGSNHSGWNDRISGIMTKWYTACPENGGWGSLFLSWEWYASYEKGDKRRDASCVTGAVPQEDLDKYGIQKSDYVYGYHPFLQTVVGNGTASTQVNQFHFNNGEWAPSIWSTKFWRNASAEDKYNAWGFCIWSPTSIYWKRFANVIIDLAECSFLLGKENEGWTLLDELRARAFGELETGLNDANYIKWFNYLANEYKLPQMTKYPIPFGPMEGVTRKSAKEVYSNYVTARGKKFTSPAWKIAVNEERRKEFNSEWCLRPDIQRSGFMREHIEVNYPKDNTQGTALKDYPWTYRNFEYNDQKMDMPIPKDELAKNPLCDQNPAYVGNNE